MKYLIGLSFPVVCSKLKLIEELGDKLTDFKLTEIFETPEKARFSAFFWRETDRKIVRLTEVKFVIEQCLFLSRCKIQAIWNLSSGNKLRIV